MGESSYPHGVRELPLVLRGCWNSKGMSNFESSRVREALSAINMSMQSPSAITPSSRGIHSVMQSPLAKDSGLALASVPGMPVASACVCIGMPHVVEAGATMWVTVQKRDGWHRLCNSAASFNSRITAISLDSPNNIRCVDRKDGTVSIAFTAPLKKDKMRLDILLNGSHIDGSPFQLQVYVIKNGISTRTSASVEDSRTPSAKSMIPAKSRTMPIQSSSRLMVLEAGDSNALARTGNLIHERGDNHNHGMVEEQRSSDKERQLHPMPRTPSQIGRASCRERV